MKTTIITAAVADENPFFKSYETRHGTPPFNKIKIEHYEPAFDEAIRLNKIEIETIAADPQPATFLNTIAAIEYAGEMLNRVSGVFFNLLSAESNDEMMQISQRLSPKLSEHSNNINLNEKLFTRIKAVYNNRHSSGLVSEQIRLGFVK